MQARPLAKTLDQGVASGVNDRSMTTGITETAPPRARRSRAKGQSDRQAAKSDAMRAQLLETAIDLLAERPYSDVSAAFVAEQAGVSRGGMQYHFPTRVALLQATVEYLHARRLELFRADLLALPEGADVIDHIIETHWRHLNEREFRAYQEIVLAARSEPDLAAMMAERYRAFLHAWHEISREMFGWKYTDPAVARAGNIAHYILEGMAYGQIGGQLTPSDIADLLSVTKDVLRAQRPGTSRA